MMISPFTFGHILPVLCMVFMPLQLSDCRVIRQTPNGLCGFFRAGGDKFDFLVIWRTAN